MSESQKMQYQKGKKFIFGKANGEIVGMHKSGRKTDVFLRQIHSLKYSCNLYNIILYNHRNMEFYR